MILLVDIGNSRFKWAFAQPRALGRQRGFFYTAANLPEGLQGEFGESRIPERILASNVGGGEIADTFGNWVAGHWGKEPEFITSQARGCGVTNAYPQPRRLGADRWAALVAAHSLFPEGAYIVDCGTAVTIDAISADGHHLGGLILPGLDMMRRSLAENTHGIGTSQQALGPDDLPPLLATNTEDAVTAGAVYTLVAGIERIVGEVTATLGKDTARIITGGGAEEIQLFLEDDWRHEPALVLKGLEIMARGNSTLLEY